METFYSFDKGMKFFEENEKEAEKDPEKYFNQSKSEWTDEFYPHIELNEMSEDDELEDTLASWSPDLEEEEEEEED